MAIRIFTKHEWLGSFPRDCGILVPLSGRTPMYPPSIRRLLTYSDQISVSCATTPAAHLPRASQNVSHQIRSLEIDD